MCPFFRQNGTPTQNGEQNKGERGTNRWGTKREEKRLELYFAKEAQEVKQSTKGVQIISEVRLLRAKMGIENEERKGGGVPYMKKGVLHRIPIITKG